MATRPPTTPKVAVITRTKDRIRFLERAIKSVESQTYTDYIHVILNDGGDKKQVNYLLERYKNEKRIAIHNETTVGVTRALNQAIRAVDSEYITILDDDDSWPPERLEKTIPHLEKTKENAVVVKMDIVIEEVHGAEIRKISQSLHPESGEGEISLFKQCSRNYISNGIVTYSREIYDKLRGYDESLETAEDWDFGIRLLLESDVAFLGEEKPLCFYHQRPEQQGVAGNAVHAGVSQQEKTLNIIRNRLLRNDLKSGKLGVGYIMNSLVNNASNVVRLEGHINFVAENLKKDILSLTSNQIIDNRLDSLLKNKIRGATRRVKKILGLS